MHPLELRVDEDHAVAGDDDRDVAAVLADLGHRVVGVLDDVEVVGDLDQPRRRRGRLGACCACTSDAAAHTAPTRPPVRRRATQRRHVTSIDLEERNRPPRPGDAEPQHQHAAPVSR